MKTTFIYTLSDPETLDIRYVGKSNIPSKRLSDHIYSCKRTITHKNNWIRSLISKGYKPILTVIEEVLIDNWQHREKYWIDKLKNEGHNLVNTDEGGNGTTRHSYNTIDKLILKHRDNPNYNKCQDKHHIINKEELYKKYIVENLSLNKCAKYFNTSKHTVYRNVFENGYKKNINDYRHLMSSGNEVTVCQYDLVGNFIKEWVGVVNIEKELGLKRDRLYNCCRGLSNALGGFIWRYKGDSIIMRNQRSSKKSIGVLQINEYGDIVGQFTSIKAASEQTGIQRSSISYCCRGIFKNSGGFIWKYKDIF